MFIGLLASIVNASKYTKCVSLGSQKCKIRPTPVTFEILMTQRLPYFPFALNLDRCVESSNTLNNLSNKVYIPNETDDLNLSLFNMITGINESN